MVGAACVGPLNPEDEENFNSVTFVNDTSTTVELSLCSDTCTDLHWTVRIESGDRESDVQVSNQSLPTKFLVASSGSTLGCFSFNFDRAVVDPIVVRISGVGPC
jgi:hypothetical protein